MKKYFSWFALIMALPALFINFFYLQMAIKDYFNCKDFNIGNCNLVAEIDRNSEWGIVFVSVLFFLIFYSLALSASKEAPNSGGKIIKLAFVWFFFALSLFMALVIYGVSTIK